MNNMEEERKRRKENRGKEVNEAKRRRENRKIR